jgi:GNAT superfamily N-acetyltransferase
MRGMARYEVREFTPDALDDAARLLAERHRRQRLTTPGLNPVYEEHDAARREIAALLDHDGASGTLVTSGGAASAFVLGTPRADEMWGANVWIEDAGSAGGDPEAIREAYAAAAAVWVACGRTSHFVVIPATDEAAVEAWFSLSFGKQHIYALRAPASAGFEPSVADGLVIRRSDRPDLPALAELDLVLPRHAAGSPIFARLPPLTVEEALAELEADFGDPTFAVFVAEHEGRVIGTTVACSLELSKGATRIMRPASAGLLGYAAVLPDARGLGVGRALGETVIAWARDEGYEWVAVDWRSTNLSANRSWIGLGFRPTFYRLHRAII